MKITKFVHSCLLVETQDRTAIFDPGVYSLVDVEALERLDDIFITHIHGDHFDINLVKRLVEKFPDALITATDEIVQELNREGIPATSAASAGIEFFDSPHEAIRPLFDSDPPQEFGFHYLGKLSHPGDSHNFHETMPILALPVQAPWGSTNNAVKLALELKPKYIVPIHDWHWSDEARRQAYGGLEKLFVGNGITFLKPETGQPLEIDI